MGSFLSSIFTGSDPTINKDKGELGDLGQFSSNVGQQDTGAASGYYNDILSGDPSKIAEALAPEISANQQQTQQQKQTIGQFGSRSGGNTAAGNAADTQSRANIVNLIGGEQNKAAGGLASLGTSNLGMAAGDTMDQAKISQQEHENMMKSIFGEGISSGLGALESYGLGKLPSSGGGSGFDSSGSNFDMG